MLTCRWEVGPCVSFIFMALCRVRILVCEGLEDVFPVVAHVLGIFEF